MKDKKPELWQPREGACAHTRNGMHVIHLRQAGLHIIKYPFRGYVFELGRDCSWTADGHALFTKAAHHLDLIAEWDPQTGIRRFSTVGSLQPGDEVLVRFHVEDLDNDGLPSVLVNGRMWKPLPGTIVGTKKLRDG